MALSPEKLEDLRQDAIDEMMAEDAEFEAEMAALSDWTDDMREWELAVIGR